jgi:hypothetical protein
MEVSRIAKLALFKIAGPCFTAVSFDELPMFVCLDNGLERQFDRLSSRLGSEYLLRLPDEPAVKPPVDRQRYVKTPTR